MYTILQFIVKQKDNINLCRKRLTYSSTRYVHKRDMQEKLLRKEKKL